MPIAGKVDAVLFDKTGTLTSDSLVPVGVVNANSAGKSADGAPPTQPVVDASADAALVLAGCHSLVSVAGTALIGDPIETAALAGIGWRYVHASQTATPGDTDALEAALAAANAKLTKLDAPPSAGAPAVPPAMLAARRSKQQEEIKEVQERLDAARARASACACRSLRIVHRHHFSSALQRMSTVVECRDRSGDARYRGLVKGSPEAVLTLLSKTTVPGWYESAYRSLAEQGMRVLALAHNDVAAADDAAASSIPRERVESNLVFDGFVAFACKTRSDSAMVIGALIDSAHSVFMITGDAPLTALHVAHEASYSSHGTTTALTTP